MSIQNTDWSRFPHLESELPPDVELRALEKVDFEGMKTGQVSAHKLLLAGVSPVFCKEFFGPMKNTNEVKETTSVKEIELMFTATTAKNFAVFEEVSKMLWKVR